MIDDLVAEALVRWRTGGFDAIECSLVQAPAGVVPVLTAAYRNESDPSVRDAIVFVVWQRREPENLPFLIEALRDPNRRAWQAALDGLVALASAEARAALGSARDVETDAERHAWIDEALDQIAEIDP